MTEPLTPPDCDLRGLPFMPLDVVRLCDSDLVALSTGEEFKAAVLLWAKCWLQVPAASLPDDDRILAHLSGTGTRWRKVREIALRGFVKCSDGRLYHSVIAEKAFDAWERRGEWQEKQNNKTERQRRWRDRLKSISAELRALNVTPPINASLSTLEGLLVDVRASTRDARETALTGTGTGTGTGTSNPLSNDNGSTGDFAFQGKVIRLTRADLAKWEKAYPDVDVAAHLQSRDDWLTTEADDPTRRKWFISTSNHLANLQQRSRARVREAAHDPVC